jgi:hypothetical protein
MHDFYDQDGNISLFALAARPKYSASDPRYLSPDSFSRIAQFRIEQMKRDMEANIAALEALEKKRP